MKRMVCALLTLALLCVFAAPAFALNETDGTGNVTVSATVPSTHRVTVQSDGGAFVIYDRSVVEAFDAPRLSTPQIILCANSGKQIKAVQLNGTDITGKTEGGKYTFAPIFEEQTLTIVTEDEPQTEKPGSFTVEGTITENGQPLSDVTLELRSEPKTAVTGPDGKFRFTRVTAGHHSLTAIRNGEVIGYMEFTLSGSADRVEFTLSNGVYSVDVPDSTATIKLALELNAGGDIGITGVTAEKAPADPGNSPQTGDGTALDGWVLLVAISAGLLTTLGIAWRRKKHSTG